MAEKRAARVELVQLQLGRLERSAQELVDGGRGAEPMSVQALRVLDLVRAARAAQALVVAAAGRQFATGEAPACASELAALASALLRVDPPEVKHA